MTQDAPLLARLFNLVVNAVAQELLQRLSEEVGDGAALDGLGDALRILLAVFYVDDGLLASRDPDLLQRALNHLIDLFERFGLKTNAIKTKSMTCVPGKVRTR